MVDYVFSCNDCGHVMEFSCLMSEFPIKKPQSCTNCHQTNLSQQFAIPNISVPHTLGSLADKNTSLMSKDELHHRQAEDNKYKGKDISWIPTPNGMVHKSKGKSNGKNK